MALGERLWQELSESKGGNWWQRLQGVNRQLLNAYGSALARSAPGPRRRVDPGMLIAFAWPEVPGNKGCSIPAAGSPLKPSRC